MSQPLDPSSTTLLPPPGKPDSNLNEFWVGNPWDMPKMGHNLSAYERKRAFLNLRGGNFVDISYLTGADGDGDGRCVVAGDFRNNGQMDLIVRQVGGGPVLLFENQFPKKHYLTVSLRGQTNPKAKLQSNRLGIGARLIAEVGGQRLYRDLMPHNSFTSQMPSLVHFGLGNATKIDKLTILWPSGSKQIVEDLQADRHIVIEEGKKGAAAVETVVPGKSVRP